MSHQFEEFQLTHFRLTASFFFEPWRSSPFFLTLPICLPSTTLLNISIILILVYLITTSLLLCVSSCCGASVCRREGKHSVILQVNLTLGCQEYVALPLASLARQDKGCLVARCSLLSRSGLQCPLPRTAELC